MLLCDQSIQLQGMILQTLPHCIHHIHLIKIDFNKHNKGIFPANFNVLQSILRLEYVILYLYHFYYKLVEEAQIQLA